MLLIGTVACSLVTFLVQWKVLQSAFVGAHAELSNRLCSLLHAGLVAILAWTVVMLEITLVGEISLCISIGYFLYDLFVMFTHGSDAFYPLLAHHLISAASMAYVAFTMPPAVWYTCLLQCSESTIPIQFTVWLLEQRGAKATVWYAAARWVQLVCWLVFRILLIGAFFSVLWAHWTRLDPNARMLGLGVGWALLLFNLGGLFTLVLPGIPWRAEPRSKPVKQTPKKQK